MIMLKNIISITFLAGALLTTEAQAVNKALLIGIGDYLGDKYDLEGPAHDVSALKNILQTHWGFNSANIKTLLDKEASKDNILNALKDLKENASAKDHIFIYFSGHGTSAHDTKLGLPLPYSSGALIPQDLSATQPKEQIFEKIIIGQRDLQPILRALDNTQAHTLVAFDSCYSGNTVRGAFGKNTLRSREMPLALSNDDFDIDSLGDDETAFDSGVTTKTTYPYKNIFFLSAANATEPARDISSMDLSRIKTLDGKPHGAFTDSLLRALSGQLKTDINGDGLTNYSELHTAIKKFMKTRPYGHEPQVLPQLSEDKQLLRMRGVLGKKSLVVTANPAHLSSLLTVHISDSESVLLNKLKQLSQIIITENKAELNLKKLGNDYQLTNLSGDLLGTMKSPTIQQLVGRVKQEAWKKKFNQLLQKRASINIDFSLENSLKGSSAIEGELIAFTLRSEKPVHLLLLDVNSSGTLTVLYPSRQSELKAIPARQLKMIPGSEKIIVEAPFGTDHLIAIGFSKEPDFLKEFIGKERLNLQTDLYKKLVDYFKTSDYGYNELDLLTAKKTAP